MISSIYYGICFLVLLTEKGYRIKIVSLICLSHLLIENVIYFYYSSNIHLFDLNFYLTILSSLDVLLLVSVAVTVEEWSRKLIILSGSLLIILNLVFGQYMINSQITDFILDNYYYLFIEVFIILSRLRSDTILNWLRTCIIISCLLLVHLRI